MKHTEHQSHARTHMPKKKEAPEQTKHWAHTSTTLPRYLSVWSQNIRFYESKRTQSQCEYEYAKNMEGHSKQTKHWNHANMTVSRSLSVWPKNIRFNLARRKFATSSVYDKQTSSGRLVAEVRARNKQITEHMEALLWLVHNVGDKS